MLLDNTINIFLKSPSIILHYVFSSSFMDMDNITGIENVKINTKIINIVIQFNLFHIIYRKVF